MPFRTGSITPVEPGRMRNTWYPRQKAQYMTAATEPGKKPHKIQAERDFTFGMKSKDEDIPKATTQRDEVKPIEVQTKLLSVSRIGIYLHIVSSHLTNTSTASKSL